MSCPCLPGILAKFAGAAGTEPDSLVPEQFPPTPAYSLLFPGKVLNLVSQPVTLHNLGIHTPSWVAGLSGASGMLPLLL